MDLKTRLQRVLQIVEEAERTGLLSDLEKDIALNELREAYAELKFGITENGERKMENEEQEQTENEEEQQEIPPIIPIAPITPIEEEPEEEPEVEVELIFDEESDETEDGEQRTENGERKTENEEQSEIAPTASTAFTASTAPTVEQQQDELSSLVSYPSSNKRSPLLSLYDDEPAAVIGEQFHENLSVADSITRPKGVADTSIQSLRAAIGVVDRYMLVRELFDGDTDAYEAAISALDRQKSFDDCVIYIAEHYAWKPQSEGTKAIMSLLQRKFNV